MHVNFIALTYFENYYNSSRADMTCAYRSRRSKSPADFRSPYRERNLSLRYALQRRVLAYTLLFSNIEALLVHDLSG